MTVSRGLFAPASTIFALAVLAGAGCGGGVAYRGVTRIPVAPAPAPSVTPDVSGLPPPEGSPVPPPPGAVGADLFTEDGTSLDGLLFGPGRRAGVVFVGGTWGPLAARLFAQGHAALVFDLRGHGRSQGARDPARYPLDLEEAIAFLRDTGTERVAVVGAEAGGTAAIAAAARARPALRALVVVGSGAAFGPLNAERAARRLEARVLVVSAGKGEAQELARLIPGAELRRTAAGDPGTEDLVEGFLRRTLR